jgi:hypothetical protein
VAVVEGASVSVGGRVAVAVGSGGTNRVIPGINRFTGRQLPLLRASTLIPKACAKVSSVSPGCTVIAVHPAG